MVYERLNLFWLRYSTLSSRPFKVEFVASRLHSCLCPDVSTPICNTVERSNERLQQRLRSLPLPLAVEPSRFTVLRRSRTSRTTLTTRDFGFSFKRLPTGGGLMFHLFLVRLCLKTQSISLIHFKPWLIQLPCETPITVKFMFPGAQNAFSSSSILSPVIQWSYKWKNTCVYV